MTVEVRKDEEASRYELVLDGRVAAYADYELRGEVVVLPHTVTDPAHRGQGLAAQVVQFALEDVRDAGRTVVPACWYVAQFIDGHQEFADLVAARP
jgi:predicted GNAT family acetyltransferase